MLTTYIVGRTVFSINGTGKMDKYMNRMKLDPWLPHTKINSKWIKNLYISLRTMKLLEENTG